MTSDGPPVEPHPFRAFEHAGWQGAAAHYPASFARATSPYVETLLDEAGARAGKRLLDIACGPGIASGAALQRGCHVTGVDFSSAMLGVARGRLPAAVFHEADAEALPLPGASVDAAVSNFGLHHFPDPARALREALRVLRPGGRLAATVWVAPQLNPGWQLMIDAIAAHGDPVPALPVPPRGLLNRAEDCVRLLIEAGASPERASARMVHALWRLDTADDLVDAFAAGTVRMRTLLAAQSPGALAAIRAAVADGLVAFRSDSGFLVPTRAILASAAV